MDTAGFKYTIVEPSNAMMADISKENQKLYDDPNTKRSSYIESNGCFCDTTYCGCWPKDQPSSAKFSNKQKFSFNIFNAPEDTEIQIKIDFSKPLPSKHLKTVSMELGVHTMLSSKLHINDTSIFNMDLVIIHSSRFDITDPVITERDYSIILRAKQPVNKLEFLGSSCYVSMCEPSHQYIVSILRIGESIEASGDMETLDRGKRQAQGIAQAVEDSSEYESNVDQSHSEEHNNEHNGIINKRRNRLVERITSIIESHDDTLSHAKEYAIRLVQKAMKSFPDFLKTDSMRASLIFREDTKSFELYPRQRREASNDTIVLSENTGSDIERFVDTSLTVAVNSNPDLQVCVEILGMNVLEKAKLELEEVECLIKIFNETDSVFRRSKRGALLEFLGIASEDMVHQTVDKYLTYTASMTDDKIQKLTDQVINDKKQLMKFSTEVEKIQNDMCKTNGRTSTQILKLQSRIAIESQTNKMINDLVQCANGNVPRTYTYEFITQLCKSAMRSDVCDKLGHKVYNLLTCSIKNIYVYSAGYFIEYTVVIPTSYKESYTLYRPMVVPVYNNHTGLWNELSGTKDYRIMIDTKNSTQIFTECETQDQITICPPVRSIDEIPKACFTNLIAGKSAECWTKSMDTDRTCFSTFVDSVGLLVSTSTDLVVNQFSISSENHFATNQITKDGVFLIQNHPEEAATVKCHGVDVTTMLSASGTLRSISVKHFDWSSGLSENYSPELNNSISKINQNLQAQIDNLKNGLGGKLVEELKSKFEEFAPSDPDRYKTWIIILSIVALSFLAIIIYIVRCICKAQIRTMTAAPIQTIRTRLRRKRPKNNNEDELVEF